MGNGEYELEYDPLDPFVAAGLKVAFCDRLAEDHKPIILDPRECGSKPFPPDLMGYRLVFDPSSLKVCILYEVYWARQDCTWRELNKDHDHDYEQIQVHLDASSEEVERVVVSSIGSVENGGHGVEIYEHVPKAKAENLEYSTSPVDRFPWGGPRGRRNVAEVRRIPLKRLCFEGERPIVAVLNCYHVFVGVKRQIDPVAWHELKPRLERLDRRLLDRWYYHNSGNRFAHDISKPLNEPCILYYPPPGDLKARLLYRLLIVYFSMKRIINRRRD